MSVISTLLASSALRLRVVQTVSSQNLTTEAGSLSITGSDTFLLDPAGDTNVVNFDVTSATIKTLIVGSLPGEHGFHWQHEHPPTPYPDDTINTFSGPGDWSDTTKWSQGRLPNDSDDVVHVPAGFPLVFPTGASRTINFENFLINTDGEVRADWSAADAAHTLSFVGRDVALDLTADPYQWSRVFWCLGKLRLTGKTKTSWVEMNDADATDTTVTLRTTPTGWASGDTLVFLDERHFYNQTAPDHPSYVANYETRTISSVTGTSVTLSSALTYDHHGAYASDGTTQRVYTAVGNLTRNIVMKSANKDGTRMHEGSHGRADVEIYYCEFRDTGRSTNLPFDDTLPTTQGSGPVTYTGTNHRGRYGGWHFHHHTGPTRTAAEQANASIYQGKLVGCSSWNQDMSDPNDLPRWGLCNLHNSHWILVQDNVSYHHAGSHIFGEDGGETENLVQGNLMVRSPYVYQSETTRGAGDVGFTSTGIWMRGANNRIVNNRVNAMSRGYITAAIVFNPLVIRYPLFKGADTTVTGEYETRRINDVPFLEFSGNVAGGAMFRYMEIWDIGDDQYGTGPSPAANRSTLTDGVMYHLQELGYYNYRAGFITLDGFKGYQDFNRLYSQQGGGVGIFFNDYVSADLELIDCEFYGFGTGVLAGPIGNELIQGCHFQCYRGIEINPPWVAGAGVGVLSDRTITIDNCTFADAGMSDVPSYGAQAYIAKVAFLRQSGSNVTNLRCLDKVVVTDFNGVGTGTGSTGINFYLYYPEQLGSASFPESNQWLHASPAAGKTNTQAQSDYGYSWGDEISPGTTEIANVIGYVDEF